MVEYVNVLTESTADKSNGERLSMKQACESWVLELTYLLSHILIVVVSQLYEMLKSCQSKYI